MSKTSEGRVKRKDSNILTFESYIHSMEEMELSNINSVAQLLAKTFVIKS